MLDVHNTGKDEEEMPHNVRGEREENNSIVQRVCLRLLVKLAVVVGLALQYGCEDGDLGQTPPAIEGWAKQFGVVATGQGVPGSAAYTPGNSVTVLPIYYNSYGADWYYGSLVGEHADPLVPSELIPANISEVQLVLIETASSERDSRAFFHWTSHYELREALTGRLVASANFEGDNIDPHTAHLENGAPVFPSDRLTMVPAIRAWLSGYL